MPEPLVKDNGVRNLHRCLLSSESGAETIVDSLSKLPCELSTTLYSCTEKVKVLLVSGTYTGVSCPLSLVPKLHVLWTHCRNCPVNLVQHHIAALRRHLLTDAPTNYLPTCTTHLILTNGCFACIWR